ncbi:hypothetical protein D3C71_1249460 [compost metagenome]
MGGVLLLQHAFYTFGRHREGEQNLVHRVVEITGQSIPLVQTRDFAALLSELYTFQCS